MGQHHDSLFHRVFADPTAAVALLRRIVPAPLNAAIAWPTLVECSRLLVDPLLGTHTADLVFEAQRCDRDGAILFLAEHKSEPDPFTVLQLQRYEVHLLDKWRAANPNVQHLPHVVPIVIHHGDRPWRVATTWNELHAVDDLANANLPARAFGFLLDDLSSCSEAQLGARDLPPAARLALLYLQCARAMSPDILEQALLRWHRHLRAVTAPPGGPGALQVFHSYLLKVTNLSAERLAAVIESTLGSDSGAIVMSTADKLIASGKAMLLLRQLRKRFGKIVDSVAERVQSAAVEDLDRWAERILDAKTLTDVFASD